MNVKISRKAPGGGIRVVVGVPTPQKKSKETKVNAITQPRSHPTKNVDFRDGSGIPLVSLFFIYFF